jgi:xyloglucan-specific exo-beta-1,4-glucanase
LPSKGWVSDLVIDPDEWKKCWVAYKSIDPEKKVFRYTGDKWIDIGKKLGYARVESMVLDKNSQERLYIGSNYGVFTRSKVEKEWTCLNGMPGLWMKSMAINYQASTLLIGTHGRGIWQCDLMEE